MEASLSIDIQQACAASSAPSTTKGGQWLGRAARSRRSLSPGSVRTGGYCRARQRLPLEMVGALTRQTDLRNLKTTTGMDILRC